jgi:hypothetical protein
MQLFVLADYDNCKLIQNERTRNDVEYNIHHLSETIFEMFSHDSQEIKEIRLRLYGGWISQEGAYTPRAEMLLSCLSDIRGLKNGIRMIPELATGLAKYCTENLIGLLRTDRNPPQQKMVDTLITVDALHLSKENNIAIVTDDDDLVPGAIAVSASGNGPIYLVRRRMEGKGRNDRLCVRIGIIFLTLPREYQYGNLFGNNDQLLEDSN